MRILIVPVGFPSKARPHVGIAILRRSQALAALGHDVSVFTALPLAPPLGRKWSSYRAVPEHDVVDGIPVHTVRVPILPRLVAFEYVPFLLQAAFERELDRVQPHIVHASFLLPGGQLVVRQQRVPCIVTAHGYDAYDLPYRRPGLHRACVEAVSGATRATAVSAYIARYVEQLTSRQVDVIWNGADERFFFPRDRFECRRSLGLPADRCLVAYAGHMVRAKGVFDLVEAVSRIDPSKRPLLALAGEGAELAEVEALARARGITAMFLGRLDHARIAELFAAADVVTLPSYYEGLPNVVCEAMLSGRAVVASTAGGIPEIVQHERSGLLMAPGDVDALAESLARCCQDAAFREELARGALAFARENLTWSISARRYEQLYEEVLADWRSQHSTIPIRTRHAS
jgi:glycosyltransferase involved in cell wall biosynthesis